MKYVLTRQELCKYVKTLLTANLLKLGAAITATATINREKGYNVA